MSKETKNLNGAGEAHILKEMPKSINGNGAARTVSGTRFPASWVSIPKAADLKNIHPDFAPPAALEQSLDSYHKLRKTSLTELQARREYLMSTRSLCVQYKDAASSTRANDGLDEKIYASLVDLLGKKSEYLRRIQTLFDIKALVIDPEQVKRGTIYNHKVVSPYFTQAENSGYKHLILNNKTIFHAGKGGDWGDYWLEIIDPAHRALDNYKRKWKEEMDEGCEPLPFFLWLEKRALNMDYRYLRFLNEEETELAKIEVIDGKLYKREELGGELKPLDTSSQKGTECIFSILPSGMWLANSIKQTDKIRHVSLTKGKATDGIGVLHTADDGSGHLSILEANSGHYLPTITDCRQIIDIVKAKGVAMSDDLPFVFFRHYEPQKTTIKQFLNDTKPVYAAGTTSGASTSDSNAQKAALPNIHEGPVPT